jgi:hypothetical protein
MTFITMQHIPLSSAYLCANCNCIGNCPEQCPACASRNLLGLASVLDRADEDEAIGYQYMEEAAIDIASAAIAA